MSRIPRIFLVHGPTPLVKRPRLDALLGVDLWIKRDDAAGGAEAGNKVRKLEWLLADALGRGANAVITCGGLQSNHARATALSCASLGLKCVLLLRDAEPSAVKHSVAGNALLDRLAGAELRPISPGEYSQRGAVMESLALELRDRGLFPYVIPEGGSNGLGALGYVECMRETGEQIRRGITGDDAPFDVVVHACGSGGTAAGVALGARRFGVAQTVRPVAVCDSAAHFDKAIERIVGEARSWNPSLGEPAPVDVDDREKGPAYGVSSSEQRETIIEVARSSGIILDPTYTGKAMHGLRKAIGRGDIPRHSRVLFLHTGGLPGLLADGASFAGDLS